MNDTPTLEHNNFEYIEVDVLLKPCPFCGSEARAHISYSGYHNLGVAIRCENPGCRCKTPFSLYDVGKYRGNGKWSPATKEEAIQETIKIWNNRM